MTKKQLMNRARELGVARFTKLNEVELAEAIKRKEQLAELDAQRAAEQAAAEAARARKAAERKERAKARAELDLSNTFSWGEAESDWAKAVVRRALALVDDAQYQQEKFVASVISDPCHGLSWGDSYFKAAAKGKVGQDVLNLWKGGMDDEGLREHAIKEMVRAANDGRSTSQCSNMMAHCLTEGWAVFSEKSVW